MRIIICFTAMLLTSHLRVVSQQTQNRPSGDRINIAISTLDSVLSGKKKIPQCEDYSLPLQKEVSIGDLIAARSFFHNGDSVALDDDSVAIHIAGNLTLDYIGNWRFDILLRYSEPTWEVDYFSSLPYPAYKTSRRESSFLPPKTREKIDNTLAVASKLPGGIQVNRCFIPGSVASRNFFSVKVVIVGIVSHQYYAIGPSISDLGLHSDLSHLLFELLELEFGSHALE